MAAAGRFADEKADLNPRSWLSRYRRNSIGYLTKMLLFYHGIGIAAALAGTALVEQLNPDYEEPSIAVSLALALSAGPIEETLFFGIPFYLSGNAYVMLATGAMWSSLHILNTDTFDIDHLAFGNWLFAVTSIFYSLRTWVSGKGWFAVATHSVWNGVFFSAGCAAGEIECTVLGGGIFGIVETVSFVVFSGVLLAITYALYRWKENKGRQRLAAA